MNDLKSKSQKKREAEHLQTVAVQLVALSLDKLDELPLSIPLRQAILEAKRLNSHGAIRRQAQLLGKLMRNADFEAIIASFSEMQAEDSAHTARFHDVEHWRERLIYDGKEALTAFIDAYHPKEVQHLRQLIKKAIAELSNAQSTGASKALFRYLRPYFQ